MNILDWQPPDKEKYESAIRGTELYLRYVREVVSKSETLSDYMLRAVKFRRELENSREQSYKDVMKAYRGLVILLDLLALEPAAIDILEKESKQEIAEFKKRQN